MPRRAELCSAPRAGSCRCAASQRQRPWCRSSCRRRWSSGGHRDDLQPLHGPNPVPRLRRCSAPRGQAAETAGLTPRKGSRSFVCLHSVQPCMSGLFASHYSSALPMWCHFHFLRNPYSAFMLGTLFVTAYIFYAINLYSLSLLYGMLLDLYLIKLFV